MHGLRITRGRAIRWAATAAIVAMLVLFARTVNWGATWAAMSAADPLLLALCAVVNLLSLMAKSARWWLFLRMTGARSFGLAVRATLAGAGINNLLVANAGEAARVVFVTRETGVASPAVLAALAMERLLEIVAYAAILVAAAFTVPLPSAVARWRLPALAALAVALTAAALLLRSPRAAPTVAAAVALPRTWFQRTRAYLLAFGRSVRLLATPGAMISGFALSLVAWSLQIWCYHLATQAAGIPLPVAGTVAAVIVVNAGLTIRTTPGGVGVFQLLYVLAAAGWGVSREAATGVAFLIQAMQVLPVTAIGVMLAQRFVARPPAELRG